MDDVTVTILQPVTLGNQSLACGVQVRVNAEQAQAWESAGIAQNMPFPPVDSAQAAIETIATPLRKRTKSG